MSVNRKRTIASVFMVLLVAWDMLEFALQPNRRPFGAELAISFTTLLVLVGIPLIHSPRPKIVLSAAILAIPQCLFGIVGIFRSPVDQGFGKIGPGVAAVLSGIAAIYGFLTYTGDKKGTSA